MFNDLLQELDTPYLFIKQMNCIRVNDSRRKIKKVSGRIKGRKTFYQLKVIEPSYLDDIQSNK